MNLFTYCLITYLALPLIAYHGWKRCKKQTTACSKNVPVIQDCFRSRFGFNRHLFQKNGIWIHAVSVGETRSIFPLLSRLKQTYPTLPLTVTNGSTQGALQALQFSPVEIQHQMIPYDYPFAVNRFLNQIQPKLVIMVETETQYVPPFELPVLNEADLFYTYGFTRPRFAPQIVWSDG